MHGFGNFDSAARFCCAFDELRNYLHPRSTIGEPASLSEQRRAFLDMQGKIEESAKEGHDFYVKAHAMQSPHILARAKRFAHGLMEDHKNIQVVKDLYEEVNTAGEAH